MRRNSLFPRADLFFLSVYTIYTYICCITSSLSSSLSSCKVGFWSLKLQRVHLRSEHARILESERGQKQRGWLAHCVHACSRGSWVSANNSSLLVYVIAIHLIVVMLISFVLILLYKLFDERVQALCLLGKKTGLEHCRQNGNRSRMNSRISWQLLSYGFSKIQKLRLFFFFLCFQWGEGRDALLYTEMLQTKNYS